MIKVTKPFSSSQDLTPAMNNLQTPRHLGTLPLPSLANIALISFLVVLAWFERVGGLSFFRTESRVLGQGFSFR
jgi:hypothetical protein